MNEKTILLVDEEETSREDLAGALTARGFKTSTAENGAAAIAVLQEFCFDLVITDLMMDGLDGFQVLKEAKKIENETCVIILTGYSDMTSAIDALRLGADDYLLKPCIVDDLLFRMSRCFDKQELRKSINIYKEILPICSVCKKIRDDTGREYGKGDWVSVDKFLTRKTNVMMTHGYCPECYENSMRKLTLTHRR